MRSQAINSTSRRPPDRYRALLDIVRSVTGTLSPDDLYRVLHRETSAVLEAPGFYVSLDDGEDFGTVVFYGDCGQERRINVRYPASESQVIRTGEPRHIPDRRDEHPLLVLGDFATKVTRSAISAPIKREDRILRSSAHRASVGTRTRTKTWIYCRESRTSPALRWTMPERWRSWRDIDVRPRRWWRSGPRYPARWTGIRCCIRSPTPRSSCSMHGVPRSGSWKTSR